MMLSVVYANISTKRDLGVVQDVFFGNNSLNNIYISFIKNKFEFIKGIIGLVYSITIKKNGLPNSYK
jgi:hypothetical protein